MGLYLCVFDGDEDVEGVEVGSYADFNFFRGAVTAAVEDGHLGSKCPTLVTHHDSDGEWSVLDASHLLSEMDVIEEKLGKEPPVEFNSPWKTKVATTLGIVPVNLLDCFFDIDGEPLVERLRDLATRSIDKRSPILFQ